MDFYCFVIFISVWRSVVSAVISLKTSQSLSYEIFASSTHSEFFWRQYKRISGLLCAVTRRFPRPSMFYSDKWCDFLREPPIRHIKRRYMNLLNELIRAPIHSAHVLGCHRDCSPTRRLILYAHRGCVVFPRRPIQRRRLFLCVTARVGLVRNNFKRHVPSSRYSSVDIIASQYPL